jgi:polysaccharide biosynthesis/export protein
MKKSVAYSILGLAIALLAGCATSAHYNNPAWPAPAVVTNKLDPALLRPTTDPFVLGPGDLVSLEILGSLMKESTNAVGMDGKIYFAILPGLDVWGLTLPQARARLEEELSKYMSQPQVAISLKAVGSKYVWVLGRLNKPGVYPIAGPATLLEAISMAGGTAKSSSTVTTTDLADLRHSFVIRQGKMLPVNFVRLLQEGDMSQNIYVKPDDFIYIPSALSQEVYVLGAVLFPRTVPYSDQMTVVSAISGANGTAAEAYLTHVAIVRGALTEPQILLVDYKAILSGRAPNVLLEPGDIVYVPLSPYRFIGEYADLIVTTFVRSWTANVGARTVLGNSANVGINVPLGVR